MNPEAINITKHRAIPVARYRCVPYECENALCRNKIYGIKEDEHVTYNLAQFIWEQFWKVLHKSEICDEIYHATVYPETNSPGRIYLGVSFKRMEETSLGARFVKGELLGTWSAKIRFTGGPAVDCPFIKRKQQCPTQLKSLL